jgi:hypothetical protein
MSNNGWQDDDEVTTTYGSIQLSLLQAHAAGIKTEHNRIVELFELAIRECAEGAKDSCDHCLRLQFYVATIKGDLDLQLEILGFIKAMEGKQ